MAVTINGGKRRVAVAVLLVLLTSCAKGREDVPSALLPSNPDSLSTWSFSPNDREVLLVGGAPLHVTRTITLESASIEMASGEVELLEARVSLFACAECRPRPGLVGFAGHAGSVCSTGPWPPKSYGPSYALAGFELAPGDRPSLMVYVRPRASHARTAGITVRYRDGDTVRTTRIDTDVIEISPTDDPVGDHCHESLWFGGKPPYAGLVRPLAPTSPPAR